MITRITLIVSVGNIVTVNWPTNHPKKTFQFFISSSKQHSSDSRSKSTMNILEQGLKINNTIVQSMKQLVLADFKLVFECW